MEVAKVFNKFVAIFVLAILGGFFLPQPTSATSLEISNSGKVSFGKVQPASTGTLATGRDTLNISTDCTAGYNVYATSTNGGSTSLVNLAANSNNTIATSSNTIGSASSLENNTWGLNTNSTEAANGSYYGLPAYSSTNLPTAIYTGTASSVPVYYGAKVTNALAPGTYTGEVLYSVTVHTSCLNYIITFDKNAEDATGTAMEDQAIAPGTSTPLSANTYTRPGYVFLGWSTDSAATTPTYTDGESVTDLTDGGGFITLYAVWGETMQGFADSFGCATLNANDTKELYDARDNNKYTIKKFSDGYCWMVSNLKLGYDKGYALTNELTNIPDSDNTTYYIPKPGFQGTGEITDDSRDSTTTATWTTDSTNDRHAKVQYNSVETLLNTSPNMQNAQDTSYYNFYTATLGKSYYGISGITSNYPASGRDICPKGWQLPIDGKTTTARSWASLDYALNPNASSVGSNRADSTSRDNFLNNAMFAYTGVYEGSTIYHIGVYGLWWSSTDHNSNNTYYLQLGDDSTGTSIKIKDDYYKSRGQAVRCVSQTGNAIDYMQNFNCASITSGGTATLADKRDNQEYTIYRAPDNLAATNIASKCIMTKDLNLGAMASSPNSSSAITANSTMTLSSKDSTFSKPEGSGESVTVPNDSVTVTTSWSTTDSYSNKQYRANGSGSYANRSYYSWGAAMVACPKGWRLPTTSEIGTNGIITAINSNFQTAKLSPWFFYMGGVRNSSGFGGAGSDGSYWSLNQSSTTNAYDLNFMQSSVVQMPAHNKYLGFQVRCVAEPFDGYMQDFDASTISAGQTARLKDKRDGSIYTVKKFNDNNDSVWMTQNLRIGYDKGYALTNELTNIQDTDTATYYLPPAGYQGDITSSSTIASTTTVNFANPDNQAKVQYAPASDTGSTNPQDTGYYNFYTATLGKSYAGLNGTVSGYIEKDICPKGWQMPVSNDNNSHKSWYYFYNTINNASHANMISSTGAVITYSGCFSGSSFCGADVSRLWSSTVIDSNGSYKLIVNPNGSVDPKNTGTKTDGFAVRCVIK